MYICVCSCICMCVYKYVCVCVCICMSVGRVWAGGGEIRDHTLFQALCRVSTTLDSRDPGSSGAPGHLPLSSARRVAGASTSVSSSFVGMVSGLSRINT